MQRRGRSRSPDRSPGTATAGRRGAVRTPPASVLGHALHPCPVSASAGGAHARAPAAADVGGAAGPSRRPRGGAAGAAPAGGDSEKGRSARRSPLQQEVGRSSLEEADSHPDVLGQCLVKCLGTKMPAEHPGPSPHHPASQAQSTGRRRSPDRGSSPGAASLSRGMRSAVRVSSPPPPTPA